MPLNLNKRRKTIRQDDYQHAGRDRDKAVNFPTAAFDPLDRLVVYLAKRAAAQDHTSALEENLSCEP